MSRLNVILDTNVLLVSISSKSPYHWVFKQLVNEVFCLGITSEILMEYEEIIARKYNKTVAKDVIKTLLALPNVQQITVYYKWNLIAADADDNKFVDCAVSANATGIVTGDKHFNILKTVDFPKVQVFSISEFKMQLTL